MDLMSFFTPESGQRRRQWLESTLAPVGEAARYYLGPTGLPERAGAAAQLAGLLSPGADMVDAYSASGDLMSASSPMSAATAAGALTASLGSLFLPGNARAAGDALTRFGVDESGAVKLPGFGDGPVYRVEAPAYANPGAGALFYSPDPKYVANYFSPDRVLRAANVPDGALDIRNPNTAREIMRWLDGETARAEDMYFDGRLSGAGPEIRDLARLTAIPAPTDKDVARALANLSLVRWRQGRPRVSGLAERELLDAFDSPAMTMRESDGSPSLAFRTPEIARQNWVKGPLRPEVVAMFTQRGSAE